MGSPPALACKPIPGPQDLTVCSLCWWCTLVSCAWRFCGRRNCACSPAGSCQPSSRTTRFFSLSHAATWAHREEQALLPRALLSHNLWAAPRKSGLSRGQPLLSPQPLPTPANLVGTLQERLQLPELLQLVATGPGLLQECLFPAGRRVSGASGLLTGLLWVCVCVHTHAHTRA